MKKWLAIILIILTCLLVSVYLFIPGKISISQAIFIRANRDGLYRNLSEEKNWHKWWPGNKTGKDSAQQNLSYDHAVYSIEKTTTLAIIVAIHGKTDLETSLLLINRNIDSSELNWMGSISASWNPFKRLQIYFKAKKINDDLAALLKTMRSYYSETKNVYGYDIRKELVKDSILISTYATSKTYPSTAMIYDLIGQLKKYIAFWSAKETGYPMLHVYTADSINYITRVAIPVDKKLPSSGNISYKWMLGGGNILVTDVPGGPFSINSAFQQLDNYIQDHRRTPPAIPFQSLVTDRSKVPDTSQWMTKLFYPVM